MTRSRAAEASPSRGRRWALRDVLLAAQIALCCVTVTAAFVSLRGLGKALTMDLGFQPQNAVLTRFDLSQAGLFERGRRPFPAPVAGERLATSGSEGGRLREHHAAQGRPFARPISFPSRPPISGPRTKPLRTYYFQVSPGILRRCRNTTARGTRCQLCRHCEDPAGRRCESGVRPPRSSTPTTLSAAISRTAPA